MCALRDVHIEKGRPFLSAKEMKQLRKAYNEYQDPNIQHAIYGTYRASLCCVVAKGRKSMWYHPDAYIWFRKKLNKMQGCIDKYIASIVDIDTNTIIVKPILRYESITGEADLMIISQERSQGSVQHNPKMITIVDFKCSRRVHDFSWFGQGLMYVAMISMDKSYQANTLQVFNPILQTIWEYDCSGWHSRKEFLDYLLNLSVKKSCLISTKV